MSTEEIFALTMPKWGLSMKEGKLLSWLLEEGSQFSKGDELADVETEKIASAVEAPVSGTLRRKVAQEDVVYPIGSLLAVIADSSVDEAAIDAYVEKFLADYVPPEDDDADAGPQTETVSINGANIRYLSKGEGDDTVLLVHGFGGDLDNWLFNHDELMMKSGKRVIALDLPGHGQSSKKMGGQSLAFFADTLDAFMAELSIDKAHVIGHSMGGAIALQLAASHPGRVASVGLICSAGLGDEINQDYLQGFISASSRKDIKPVLQTLFNDESLVNRQMINNILQYKRLDGVDAALTAVLAELQADGKQKIVLKDQLASMADRACVIWGRQDKVIPVAHAEACGDGVKNLIVENAGHMVQMEAANQVNDFLLSTILS